MTYLCHNIAYQKVSRPSCILNNKGFTLIEMMVALAIVAIMAAIAVPSYRQYSVRNAESQAQAKMRQLQTELDRWRATNLTYRGFRPRQVDSSGGITYAYANSNNTQINIPDNNNPKYTITLFDGGIGTNSLVPTDTATINVAGLTPNGWRMRAEPADYLKAQRANVMTLNSRGVACKIAPTLIIDSTTFNDSSTALTCPIEAGAIPW